MNTDIDTDNQVIRVFDEFYMGMFTDRGNMAVYKMVLDIAIDAFEGSLNRRDLQKRIEKDRKALEAAGYGEVFDTEPRMAIASRVNKIVCKPMKWQGIDNWLDDIENYD